MTEIPPMTDPLGRYWDQPSREEILVDEDHAVMTETTLRKLRDYSCTVPTGVYDGKMWRRRLDYHDESKGYLLCWYAPCADPKKCAINARRILLVDERKAA